jgi:hypothetical protein
VLVVRETTSELEHVILTILLFASVENTDIIPLGILFIVLLARISCHLQPFIILSSLFMMLALVPKLINYHIIFLLVSHLLLSSSFSLMCRDLPLNPLVKRIPCLIY